MKNKVAIYIRVSTHWQIDKDSLQVQKRELAAYSEMVLGISEYVVFEDPGFSGKNTKRPAFQEMMLRIRSGEFSHLLVWKIDRISRNLLDFANMYTELKQSGVIFVSKNEQFDTSTAIGEAMLKIILIFAELERNMTAERVSAVMLSRATQGQWNGGRIPFGYDFDKETRTFSINEHEKKVIEFAMNRYEDSASLATVTNELNSAGYRSKKGNLWTPTTVRKIISNVFNAGIYRYNVHNYSSGEIRPKDEWIDYEDHHPAITTLARIERISKMLKSHRRGSNADTRTYDNVHVFSGKIRCGLCGKTYFSTSRTRLVTGIKPSVYACPSRRKGLCSAHSVQDTIISPFVFDFIANILHIKGKITPKTQLEQLRKKLVENLNPTPNIPDDDLRKIRSMLLSGISGIEFKKPDTIEDITETEMVEDRMRKIETALSRLRSLYLFSEKPISEKEYADESKRLTEELEELKKKIDGTKTDPSEEFKQKASYFLMVEYLIGKRPISWDKIVRELDRSVPKAFIHRILDHLTYTDRHVTEIEFQSGLTIHFTYENTPS